MASKIAILAAFGGVIARASETKLYPSISTKSSLGIHGEQHLRRLSKDEETDTDALVHSGNGALVDGTETVYDDFSMAWRFLGFYTDCNVCLDEDGNEDNEEDYEQFVDPSYCIKNNKDKTVCRRYALWAAYVDEGYEGNGGSEYQYYDRIRRKWDKSGCDDNDDSRCAKMDCHDPSSKNFRLLGVFKDHKTDAFLENMFGYSGDCVWNDNEYKFMKSMNNYKNEDGDEEEKQHFWPPKKCTAHKDQNDGSVVGYYDAVPTRKGNLGVALYTDDSCTIPYEGDEMTAEEVLGKARSLGGDSNNKKKKKNSEANEFAEELKSWNSAMDAFKICQPCVSYETLFDKDTYNTNGDRYLEGEEEQQDGDEKEEEQDDENFVCRDNLQQDEPINQCRVFVEQGMNTMTAATYRDILLAESQGTVTGIDLSPTSEEQRGTMVMGEPFIKPKHTWLSLILLFFSMGYFWVALRQLFEKDRSKHGSNLDEPLVQMERTSSSNKNNNNGIDLKNSRSRSNFSYNSEKSNNKRKKGFKMSRSRSKKDDERSSSNNLYTAAAVAAAVGVGVAVATTQKSKKEQKKEEKQRKKEEKQLEKQRKKEDKEYEKQWKADEKQRKLDEKQQQRVNRKPSILKKTYSGENDSVLYSKDDDESTHYSNKLEYRV